MNRSRVLKWIFPVFLALVLVALMVADMLEVLTRTETVETVSAVGSSFSFLSQEPVLDLRAGRRATVEGPFSPFGGFSFGEGWTRFTDGGVWSQGEASRLHFHLINDELTHIGFDCRPFYGIARNTTQVVMASINGVALDPLELETRNGLYRLEIPEGALRIGANTLDLRYAHHLSPREASGKADTRQLGVHFSRIALFRGERTKERELPDALPVAVDAAASTIDLEAPGQLIIPFSSERAVDTLNFGFQVLGVHKARAPRLEASVFVLEEGSLRRLNEVEVDLQSRRNGQLQLALNGAAGEIALVVELAGSGKKLGLRLKDPHMVLANIPRGQEVSRDPGGPRIPETVAEALPDVVMIILDAARADHTGRAYGYDRNTAPAFDNVASTSLVFSKVRAQASYTACSVPTMLTGTSFASHGVVSRSDRLHSQELTLAEILSAEGYMTIGYSASPNNSVRLGLDQGYDEFHELWKGRPWIQAVDPFLMARLVEQRLRKLPKKKPYFLMLHFVPPHSPYTPRPQFRKWNDPDYRGECDGTEEYLDAIHKQRFQLDDEDIQELVALYDGNLHMADAAVKRVVRAVVRLGRRDDTLLLITSDHGEAFFEHGKQGHNSTIYEEMIRVPLLLRLPKGARPEAVDLDREASLEDLVPTVLGVLGIPGGERISGRDLLSRFSTRDRFLLRTAPNPGVIGLKLGPHKVMRNQFGRVAELYDLSSDPEERHNLAVEQPVLMALLTHALEAELGKAPPPFEREGEAVVSEEDAEALKALGYARD